MMMMMMMMLMMMMMIWDHIMIWVDDDRVRDSPEGIHVLFSSETIPTGPELDGAHEADQP